MKTTPIITTKKTLYPALQMLAALLLCIMLLCCPCLQTASAAEGDPGHSGTSSFNEADGNKIESIHLVWNTEDTRDNGDIDFLWLSSSSTTPLSMKFTLQVNLSGQADAGDYAPGSLRIRIPRQIWHKRDTAGEPGSTLEDLYGKLDVPVTITPNPNVDWYYEIDGDYCVFVNNKKIGATSNHSFECTVYDIHPLMIVDESISENLQAHIDAVTSLGSTIWMDSNILTAQIDTSERISGATKNAKLYEFIDDDDGVPQGVLDRLPEGTNPEDYVYVRWTTRSTMSGNQYFSLAIDDPETWCYDRVLDPDTQEDVYIPECQGIFLAETDAGNNVLVGLGDEPQVGRGEIYNDGKSYKNDYVSINSHYTTSRTLTLWAAYPNATFQEGHTYYFRNKDEWDLLEYDPEVEYWEGTDAQVLTEANAANSVNFTKMKWVYPPGRFLAFKFIETNRGHKHPYYDSYNSSHKKQHTYEMALNRLRDGQDVTMEYELLTVGYGYMFTAGPLANVVEWEDGNGVKHSAPINDQYNDNWDSEEWIQDPEHFCNWYYVMDTSDRWDFFNYVNRAGGDPQLTGDDYQFDGVYIQAPEIFDYDRQKNSSYRFKEDVPFGYYPSADTEKIPTVELWVEYDNVARIDRESDSGNPEGWTYMGEYEVKNGLIWIPFDNTTDAGIITGIRTRVTTNQAACKLSVYPHITLKATDRVRSIVEQLFVESGTPSTTFRNDDNLYIELFKTAEDQSVYSEQTNPEGKVHPNQQMFLDEDVYFRQDIWDDSAIAKFTGAGYGITLNKHVRFDPRSIEAGGDNDIINKRAILHYTATCTQTSNLTSLGLYNEAVESGAVQQDYSCVWYDLLPEKVQPIIESVRMTRAGDKVLRVTTIPNYKDTGRIMMIVECELKPSPGRLNGGSIGEEIPLTFDAYITWLDLNSMPENYEFVNYVAYESGIEGQVGTIKGMQGEKDTILPTPRLNNSTPSGVPESIAQVFTDLNPDSDEGRFVYARAPITPRVNMDAHTEYVKYVRNDLDGIWTQGLDGQHQVNVYEGHNYTYRLTVASAKGTNTWDMVFYDSIENYLIPRPDPDDPMHDATKEKDYLDTREKADWQGDWQEGNGGAPGGQWRGRLYQVDLSELYEMDCAPVLYYCTIPWMQFSDTYGEVVNENVIFNDAAGHYMLEDINTWTPVDMSTLVDGKWNVPDGLEVTAIAVDAKKTTDGEQFILRSKESVSFYLHMTAPDDQGMEDQWHAKGAYARFKDDASTFEDIDWEAATNPENNMHAFNNTRLISRQANEDDSTMRAFLTMIRNDYTRVGIMPVVKYVEKVWDDDDNHDNLRPDSITVEMLRKTQLSAGDYEPVIDVNTGEPVTLTITPTVVEEEVDGEIVEKEVWKGIFYQVPVVDAQGNRYLYQFRDTVTGYTCSSAEDAQGNIILTNTHENETVLIKGEKQWLMPDGADLSDEAVALVPESITAHLYRTGLSGEEEFVTTITVTPDATGKWTYDFGPQEKYERGGFAYTYTIKEDPVTGFVSSLMDPSLLPEGYEVPFLGSADYNPDMLETFYNFYVPLGDLAVQKNILQATDVSSQKDFTFTLELTDPDDPDTAVAGSYDYAVYTVLTNGETGEETLAEPAVRTGKISSGDTFTIKGGQRIIIRRLPVGIDYAVTEAAADGWNVSAAPGETAGPVMENATGIVRSGETVQATFTNTYTASGYAQVMARKQLTGREMITSAFGFELVDNNPDSETYGQVILSAYNQTPSETVQDDNGVIVSVADVKFGSLAYTEADAGKTFHYQVREKNVGNPGYTYNDSVFDVTVAVTDNGNGTLTTVVSPADPAELVFENVYEAQGELTLRGWKQLQKRDAEDEEFTFELWQSNADGEKLGGAPLQTVKNDADSNVIFAPITFDQTMVSVDEENPFVYYYLMTEKDTGDDTIIYSGYQHLFIVTPQDNGNGTISFDQQDRGFNADGSEADTAVPVFINDVENGHLKLSKAVTNGNPATKFTFKVKLVGMEGGSFDLERSGGSTADGEENPEEEPPATASGLKPVYYAPAEEINGRDAFAALNKTTGELVFFRTDPNAPMDPWGNTFTNSGFSSNRKVSADGNFIWYIGVESGSHAWTNSNWSDATSIRTVTMRDPLRPSTLTYFFQNCTYLESVNLDKMDLHNANGSVKSSNWLYGTFSGTPNIKEIDLGSMDLSKTSDLQYAFKGCNSLETLNIGHLSRTGQALSSKVYQDFAFTGTKITRITIGDSTTFSVTLNGGFYDQYPIPPAGYNDLWINVDTNEQLTSLKLFTEGGHGGTWELDPKQYKITFDANGGTGAMASKTVNVRREFVTGYNFYKFGYDFVGFRDNYGTLYPVNGAGKVTIPSNTYTDKIVAGEELQVTLYAEWAEVDNSANATGDTLTVTLYGGESVTIKNLPAYTAYEVWEELPSGWRLVSKVNDSGEIQPLETSECTFTNKYAPNEATVNLNAYKLMDGVRAGGYTFALYEADSSWQPVGEPIDTKVSSSGGIASFDVLSYGPEDTGDHRYVIAEVVENPDPTIEYDTDLERVTVTVSDDGAGNMSAVAGYHVDGGIFRNNTKPGSLKLTKNIVNPTMVSAEQEFTFRITFFDRQGNPAVLRQAGEEVTSLRGMIADESSSSLRQVTYTVTDGAITAILSGGETLNLTDVIPAGVNYEIEELNLPPAWKLTETTGATGSILSDQTSEAVFTNTYSAKGTIPMAVEKLVEGETPEAGAFTFELYPYSKNNADLGIWDFDNVCPREGQQPLQTVTNNQTDNREQLPVFIAPEHGTVTLPNTEYLSSMAVFQPIEVTEEGFYIYAIREAEGSDSTMIYDESAIYACARVTDVFGDGRLITDSVVYYRHVPGTDTPEMLGIYGYLDLTAPTPTPLYFTNNIQLIKDSVSVTNPVYLPMNDSESYARAFLNVRKDGELAITKQVTGATEASDGAEFTITVKLTDKNGQLLADKTYPTTVDGAAGQPMTTDANGIGTVTVQDGQTLVIGSLPHGAAYEVSETDLPGGFTLENIEGAEGVIVGAEQSTATVHNTYGAVGSLELVATKVMTPAEFLTLDEGRFTFEVKDDRGSVIRSAVNTADGQVVFDPINYTMADLDTTFLYTITEAGTDNLVEIGAESPYATDITVYTVQVTLADNGDGTLQVTPKIQVAEEETDIVLFSNTEKTKVEVTKTWAGDEEHPEKRPSYIILTLHADGEMLYSRAVNAERNGTDDPNVWAYTFNNLPKYKDGQLITYTVTEETTAFYYPTIESEGNTFAIRNTYSDTSIGFDGSKTYTDHLTGEAAELTDGQFRVRIAGKRGTEPLPQQTVVDVLADGSFDFGTIDLTLEDLGVDAEGRYNLSNTLTYRISEVIPESVTEDSIDLDTHIRYDDTVYEINVALSYDPATGELTAQVDPSAENLTFANESNADICVLNLTAEKQQENRDPLEGEYTFVLDWNGDRIASATNDAQGLVTFPEITYCASDLTDAPVVDGIRTKNLLYTMYEVDGGITGISYDDHVETITVTLTENEDGSLTVSADKTGDDHPVFVNTLETTGISVTKEWVNMDPASITLTLGSVQNDAFVALDPQPAAEQNGLTYSYTDLPKYDPTGVEILYAVQEGTQPEHILQSYTNESGEDRFALDGGSITNSYTAEGEIAFSGLKTLEGRTPEADEFSFTLFGSDGEAIETVHNDADGAFAFSALRYIYTPESSDLGEHTYTVKEESGSLGGVTYDEQVYTITVTVSDNGDGTLAVTATDNADSLNFTNTYEAHGELVLTASKTVNGAEPREDQVYEFVLTAEDGTALTASNVKSEITFDALTYDLTDAGKTHTYTVQETTASTDMLAADESIYTVEVTVTDNGDGTLKAEPVITKDGEAVDGIVFANRLTTSLTIGKTVEGMECTDAFSFTVTLYNADGSEATEAYPVTGDHTGEIRSGEMLKLSHGQSATITGLLPGMTYAVTESPDTYFDPSVDGVSDNAAEGTLTEDAAAVSFVNIPKTTEFSVTKNWRGGGGGPIQLTLYANGKKLQPQPAYSREGDVYVYTGLPKYDGQKQTILYSAKEKYVDGFLTIYMNVEPYTEHTKAIYNGGTIINKAYVKADFSVKKEWRGLAEGETAPAIELVLYCNGEATDYKTPDPDRNGWYKYYDLPGEVDDVPAVYTVKEVPVDGYDTAYQTAGGVAADHADNGGTIINTKIPQTGDETPLALWLTLLAVSAIGLVLLLKRRKS